MQTATDDDVERGGIKGNARAPESFCQGALRKMLAPLLAALVVVCELNAVRAIPYPIHEAQRYIINKILIKVIFNQDERTRDARGFTQQCRNIARMMEHIHKEANIE
jgi:hypothetical protein